MSIDTERLAEVLEQGLVSESATDEYGNPANVTDALTGVARALQLLGNAGASTPMGALEAHGAATLEASEKIAGGLHDVADAIREAAGGGPR